MTALRRHLAALVFVAAALSSAGCFHHRLAFPELPAATEPQSRVVWTFAWGLVQQTVQPDNCMGNGASEVTVTTNLGFALLTVATLGSLAPAVVEWRCAKDQPSGPVGPGEL